MTLYIPGIMALQLSQGGYEQKMGNSRPLSLQSSFQIPLHV